MRLTLLGKGTLVGSVLLVVAGTLLGEWVALFLGFGGLAAIAVAAGTVIEPPPAEVSRVAEPSVVDRFAPATVTLVFANPANRKPRPFNVVEMVDHVAYAAAVDAVRVGESQTITYSVDTSRRGLITVGPLLLRRTDPFGLVIADRRVGAVGTITVHPRRLPVRLLPQGRLRDLEGPTREVAQGSATFHQLREYVPGDDLRHIHWRSSARQGTLMVKHLVDTTRPEIVVVVDNRVTASTPTDFEELVEVAASVLASAEEAGHPAQLIFTDGDAGALVNGAPVPYLDRLTAVARVEKDSLLDIADALRARGRSLIFVGSELTPSDLLVLTRLGRGFSPAYLVSVVAERTGPLVAPPGITAIGCSSANGFLAEWGRR